MKIAVDLALSSMKTNYIFHIHIYPCCIRCTLTAQFIQMISNFSKCAINVSSTSIGRIRWTILAIISCPIVHFPFSNSVKTIHSQTNAMKMTWKKGSKQWRMKKTVTSQWEIAFERWMRSYNHDNDVWHFVVVKFLYTHSINNWAKIRSNLLIEYFTTCDSAWRRSVRAFINHLSDWQQYNHYNH